MYDVNIQFSNTNFKFCLSNDIYVLTSASGNGKSLILDLLYVWLRQNNVPVYFEMYTIAEHSDVSNDLILNTAVKSSVVLLDNADLYMNVDLCRGLKALDIPVVIALHRLRLIDSSICKIFRVVVDINSIRLEPYV